MRAGLAAIVAALLIAGCDTPTTGSARASPRPTPTPAFIPVSEPFDLYTHCGILGTDFAGRAFYLETLDPSDVPYRGNPSAPGWMTLVSPHVAEFTDAGGHRIRFVDYLPGEVDHPYPLTVLVMSGGNQLGDRQFAGRRWRTTDTLPGVVGPPYGNGQDAFTEVYGTMTLLGDGNARFKSNAGAIARFSPLPPVGCA